MDPGLRRDDRHGHGSLSMSAPFPATPTKAGVRPRGRPAIAMRRTAWQRAALWSVLLLFALLFLMPMYVMLATSLKDMAQVRNGSLMSLPTAPTLAPWAKAWSGACTGVDCRGLKPFFLNSVLMVIPAVLVSSALGAVNGYVLSKWRFRGSELMFALMLFGMFMPLQVVLLPMSQVLGWLGIASSIWGLVLLHILAGLPSTTLFFRNYYVGLPDELIKAAMLDGAGFWRIFQRIVLPLSAPILVVTLIWQFTNIWNDFLFGVVFSGNASKPITVGLNNLANTSSAVKDYNVDMAAAMIAALPTLFVYIVAGKYFVRGLTAGAVKG
jgi:glucose/mannose transport system permease protein